MKAKRKLETDLQTVELSNGGNCRSFTKIVFMGVFHSWSRTWIFEIGIGDLPMCCQSAEYSEPLKNLDTLACTKAFPQTPSPVFTAIHPINTTGLFNYRIRKLLVV